MSYDGPQARLEIRRSAHAALLTASSEVQPPRFRPAGGAPAGPDPARGRLLVRPSGLQARDQGLSLIQALSRFDRILVAVADDAASAAAVGAAAELAAQSDAEVLALHVWCRDVPCRGPSAADCGLRQNDDSLERALRRLRKAGVRCRGELRQTVDDRILHALLRAADEYDASLVIVGGRHRRGLLGALRPGLGFRLARRSGRPVLLVP